MRAVAAGYRDYVGKLYESAQIDGIIFDDGYPLPQIPMDTVREQIPVSCQPIYRIEPLIVDLLKQDLSWSEFRQAIRRHDLERADVRRVRRGQVRHRLPDRSRHLAAEPDAGPGLPGAGRDQAWSRRRLDEEVAGSPALPVARALH